MPETPLGVFFPGPDFTSPPGFSGENGVFQQLAESVNAVVEASWHNISSADFPAGSNLDNFTVPVPSNKYSRIRLHMRGALTATPGDTIIMRVNADTTAGMHRTGIVVRQASNGAVTSSSHADAITWRIAEWSAEIGCVATTTLFFTDVASFTSYEASGVRPSSLSTSHRFSESGGRLNQSRTVTSLLVGLLGTAQFERVRWWLDGIVDR